MSKTSAGRYSEYKRAHLLHGAMPLNRLPVGILSISSTTTIIITTTTSITTTTTTSTTATTTMTTICQFGPGVSGNMLF